VTATDTHLHRDNPLKSTLTDYDNTLLNGTLIDEAGNERGAGEDDRIDLIELAVRLAVEWRRWLIATVVVFGLGVLLIFSITPLYEASASLLPQSKGATSGVAALLSGHSSGSDMYLGLLASRSLQDEVIDTVHLDDVYKVKSREAMRGMLASRSTFKIGTDTLITIKVRDKNAVTAMRIANAYLDALDRWQERTAAHGAEVRSKFFQAELAKESTSLADAEEALKRVQVQTGVLEPVAQTQIGLNQVAQTRAQITSLKVQLASLLLGSSDQNPQVQQLRAEISSLEGQVHSMEVSARDPNGKDSSVRSMPGLNLTYANKYRDVQYHEALMKALTAQYQVAHLDSNYGDASFDIVDRAIAAENKAWPPRKLLLIADAIASALLGIVFVVLTLFARRILNNPANSAHWENLRASLRSQR
jgi:tyrosine-protein kinase Etk/Wzc